MRKRVLVCAVLACAMTATSVSAQIPDVAKRVGVGGSVGGIFPIDDDVSAGLAGGLSFGLAPAAGLGPTIGFGWYQADLTLPGVSGDVEVGRLRVRPLMGGIGYTWMKGRVATGVSISAGISFNSIKLDDQVPDVFRPWSLRSRLTRATVSRPGHKSGSNTPSPGRSAFIRARVTSLLSSTM